MLSSSSMEVTIQFFLNFVKARSPGVVPVIIMSDRDKAQMNAVNTVYPDSRLLLCWWHVLCAIRMHSRMEEFPGVWSRIREWVKTACHNPSHGGFYMAEGAFYIRIGLPPRVVSGDCLVPSRHGLIDCHLHCRRAHPMSCDWGCTSTFY